MKLQEYAKKKGIDYLTAWRHLKKGYLTAKKVGRPGGGYEAVRIKKAVPKKGAPIRWTRGKVVKEICKFCKSDYITTKKLPAYLYKLAIRFCGSLRQAKWEAGIIRDLRAGKNRSVRKFKDVKMKRQFLKWVRSYCQAHYRKSSLWPGYMRQLAVRYYGSVRAAKFASGILKDQRKRGGVRHD